MQWFRLPALMLILWIIVWSPGCHQPEVPEYLGFQNLRLSGTGAQGSVLSAEVRFYNPNAFSMQLKKAEMDVFLNEKLANHYLLDSVINIRAKDSFWVPVNLKLDVGNVLGNAFEALVHDQLRIRLEGHARVKRGSFSFRVPIHYEETQKLSTLMKGMIE